MVFRSAQLASHFVPQISLLSSRFPFGAMTDESRSMDLKIFPTHKRKLRYFGQSCGQQPVFKVSFDVILSSFWGKLVHIVLSFIEEF